MNFNTRKAKKDRVCRVCLGDVKNKDMSLFQDYKNLPLYKHIISIANLNIRENDGFPYKICSQCLAELDIAVGFKKKCEESNIIFQTTAFEISSNNTDTTQVLTKVKQEPEETVNMYLDSYNFDVSQTFGALINNEVKSEDEEKGKITKLGNFTEITDDNAHTSYDEDGSDEIVLKDLKQNPQFKSKAIDLHLQCDDCKDFFKSKCKLRVHWKKVHLRQQLICQTCKREFGAYKPYLRHHKIRPKTCIEASNFHVERLGKSRIIHCKECSYKSKRMEDMIAHKVTHTGERPYACDKCGTTHTQISSLLAHKESAHGEYRVEITCQYCGKTVKGRNKAYKHLQRHASQSVKCAICEKVLKNKKILRTHMLRHSGPKTQQCDSCDRTFYTLAEKLTHKKKVHLRSELKIHECDLCSYKTSYKSTIMKHRSKHAFDNFPCTHCGMFFTSAHKLRVHKQRHFNRNHSCLHCDKKFERRDGLTKHIKRKHVKPTTSDSSDVKQQNKTEII